MRKEFLCKFMFSAQGAGLSSSSALVVAVVSSTLHALDIQVSPETLADVCAKAEKHVGVEGNAEQAKFLLSQCNGASLSACHKNRYSNKPICLKADFLFIRFL